MYLGQFPTLPQWLLLAGLFQPSVINFLGWFLLLHQSLRSGKNNLKLKNTQTFQWSIRRTFADFSEAWFYGNELVGGLVILGVLTDWFVNINHITNGSGLVPDILMRQMIASAVGVFLYRKHFAEEGWYPTFMPLVSIVPGVILMTGGGFWLSLAIAVLAGISAAPVGNYIAKRLPPFVPGAVGFVSGMAVVTILLSAVLHTF